MITERILIIGANSTGVSAASAARKMDLNAEITLLSEEEYCPYSRCVLPYVLSDEIPRFRELTLFSPSYYRMMKLDLRIDTIAKSIDLKNRSVQLEKREGERKSIEYDALILCTGVSPFIPRIMEIDKREVFTLRSIRDGRDIPE